MRNVLLVRTAAEELERLAPAERSRAVKALQEIEARPLDGIRPKRVHSALLNKPIYLVRRAGIRLLFEVDKRRTVILAVEG